MSSSLVCSCTAVLAHHSYLSNFGVHRPGLINPCACRSKKHLRNAPCGPPHPSREGNPSITRVFLCFFPLQPTLQTPLCSVQNLLHCATGIYSETIWIWLSFSSGTSENRTWASRPELFRPPLHYGEAIFITHVVSEFCSTILINPNVCKSSQCLSFDIQDMSMYLARPGANS
jgi:hypothetical protein